MNANYIINAARHYLEAVENRSAWEKGVNAYADDMLDDLLDEYPEIVESGTRSDVESALLNGAENWSAYSWGGCALIYNNDIAKLLCSPSEYRKTNGGERRPNSREEWLDVQARALRQAARLVYNTICKARRGLYIAPDGMQYEHNQPTGLYISRYYARKAAGGADVVVKVDGGYKIMTAADYRVWKMQK